MDRHLSEYNMAKNVLLIVPNSSKKAYQALSDNYAAIEMPTWAALLANVVRKAGHGVSILDLNIDPCDDESVLMEVSTRKPDLVLLVVYGQNPNSGTTSMIGASHIAGLIKDSSPPLPIAIIGSHCSALPFEVISQERVDFVFLNDGVLGLVDLLETNLSDNLENVRGMLYRSGEEIKRGAAGEIINGILDDGIPGYAFDLLPKESRLLDKYRAHYWHNNFSDHQRSPFAAIYTSLGCSFSCGFCMINVINRTSYGDVTAKDSRGMRFWTPNFILEQLQFMWDQGVRSVRLSDEMFFLNKKYYVPILQGLIDRGIKFNMWAYARVDSVRPEMLPLFKEAGINWLCLGIEAGNQVVRQEIDKGKFQSIDIREVCQNIQNAGISILGNYMFGFPDDNYQTMQETLDLALELRCEHANFYTAMALPGSPLYNFAKSKSWSMPRKYEEYAFLSYECRPLRTKYLEAHEVLAFRDNAWIEYFTDSNYLSSVNRKFGPGAVDNIKKMSQIKLRRELLGH